MTTSDLHETLKIPEQLLEVRQRCPQATADIVLGDHHHLYTALPWGTGIGGYRGGREVEGVMHVECDVSVQDKT